MSNLIQVYHFQKGYFICLEKLIDVANYSEFAVYLRMKGLKGGLVYECASYECEVLINYLTISSNIS